MVVMLTMIMYIHNEYNVSIHNDDNIIKNIYCIYIYTQSNLCNVYIYMYVCMYVCMYVYIL